MLVLRKVLGFGVIIAISIFLYWFIPFGAVNLVDLYTGIAIGLVLLCFTVGYWIFKPEIEKISAYRNSGILKQNKQQEKTKKPELTVEYDEKNRRQYSPTVEGHRVLRIRVINNGDVKAKKCESRVEVFSWTGSRLTEEIYVIWIKNNDTKSDIPKHDSVFLNVVFSTIDSMEDHLAFVAHPKSSDFSKPPRLNEGLKVGNYKLKIRIKPLNSNEALYVNFYLQVKENWEEITMLKLDEYLSSE